MRIRVIRKPPVRCVDGLQIDTFLIGQQYEVGPTTAALFLVEGWAEPAPPNSPAEILPFSDADPFLTRVIEVNPKNLIREMTPPYLELETASDRGASRPRGLVADSAADRSRRKPKRRTF